MFSTDEDARQAMMLSGGSIKGIQVTLHLSSRAEMQKVIELARSQVNQAFMLQQPKQQPKPPVINPMSSAMIANQYSKKNQETNNPVLSTPNPLANFFAHKQQQQQQQQLQKQNQNSYAPMYSTNTQMSSFQDPRTAQMRSRSPMDDSNGRKVKKSRFSAASEKVELTPQLSNVLQVQQNLQNLSRNQNQIQPEQLLRQQQLLLAQQQAAQQQSQFKPQSNAIWDQPPPFQNYNTNPTPVSVNLPLSSGLGIGGLAVGMNASLQARNIYQTEHNALSEIDNDIGFCVKVSNVSKDTEFEDLKKFFVQLPINDIKFLPDNRGNRNGVALIRFASSDAKKKALTRNMWQLNKSQVMIMPITEEEYETGILSSVKSRKIDDYRSRDRSNSRERDYRSSNRYGDSRGDRDNFNHGGNNFNSNNNFHQRDNNRNNRSIFRNNDNHRGERNERNNDRFDRNEDKPIEYPPDENFTVLKIDDIPRNANDADICEAFPSILTITIDRYTAFAKFASHEAAKETLENRFIHYIKNKRVFIEAASEAQYDELVKRNGKCGNPEFADTASQQSNDSSQKRSFESRDPRDPRQRSNFDNDNRNERNDRNGNANGFNSRNNANNQLRTDCIIIKGMDPETSIEDVETFFRDIGIYKMKVHILLDTKGLPCGDCFVEFRYPNDVPKACNKNNSYINKRQVNIMMIPREQVEAILNSFTPGTGSNNVTAYASQSNTNNNRGEREDRQNRWAPPSNFGTPGCVVMISNLSYRASIDNIVETFSEYGLRADQITRRFNDNG